MSDNQQFIGGSALARGVRALYNEGQTDYSLEPIILVDELNIPVGMIEAGDGVIFCCRRGEREIQLTEAFTSTNFDHFSRKPLNEINFAILTLYHEKFKNLPVAFAPSNIKKTMGECVSRAKLRQLRIAESEKFAHITFFMNGGNNQIFDGEDQIRIPSPKGVPYEEIPELSLEKVSDGVLQGIKEGYDLIVTNFANGDVIGHTANPLAKIRCAEIIDQNLEKVLNAAVAAGYVVFITADHGNLEKMFQSDGTPHVSHTENPVPVIVIDPTATDFIEIRDGILADIAPTVMNALDVESPDQFSGVNLIRDHDWGGRRRVLLIILDGWGLGENNNGNPIYVAKTPFWDRLLANFSHAKLGAAGEAVGLNINKAGNSEAGHMNIGAGRIVLQDDVRLDLAMVDGTFYQNEVFLGVMNGVKHRKKKLHLIGLMTEKSSHGSIDYPLALLRLAKAHDIKDVCLHLIFDGRSTQPGSAPDMLEQLEKRIEEIGIGRIATGIGRKFALDRDGNYSRTKLAYEAFVSGTGRKCTYKGDI
jgi:2,3-bisphosphoglycerate-independent phosphoglycerate mutase